jgi:signal transduction histidine kinase
MAGATHSPLVKRILLLVGGLGVAVSLLWGVIASQIDRTRSLQAASESAGSAIEASTEPIALAAWLLDQRLLAAHTRGLTQNRAIVYARVVAADGMTLAEAGVLPPGGSSLQRSVTLRSPDGKTRIGELQVSESLADVEAEVGRRSAWLFAGEVVKVLLLMAIVLVVVHGLVTRRLASLSKQLQAAPADGTSATISMPTSRITGRDELVLLAEALNQHLQDREAVRRLARERDSAAAASQAKSDFLSRMSHELRTPLNGILGFAQAFRRHPAVAGDETLLRYARLMLRSGWHLKSLIDDVLDLSRIESGTARIALGPVDVGGTIEAATSMLRTEAEARRIAVDTGVPFGLPAAMADPLRLQQVLINLVSNAIKYNREGGRLQVLAGTDDDRVWIRVVDTGLGMSPEQLAMLFQPFNRLGREHTGAAGTGIGLVITRRLVEMMNGQIQVDSVEGVGSQFTVWLPVSAAQVEPLPTRPAKLGPAEGQRRTVLYVEDDPVNVEVMRALLQARPLITLEVATDLAAASMQIGRHTPDLVLLDMNLPDGEGLVLLQALREDPQHHDLPVVVVSADAMDASVGRAMQAGAQAYLSKPYNFDAALKEVDKLLA